ncbi:MAG: hypothetical protein MI892_18165 [Desulfobacterales bacterium]|nr:hypothetical protein [Desulfobacterales bacterium]
MKKLIFLLICIAVVLLALAAYKFAGRQVYRLSHLAADTLENRQVFQGVRVNDIRFQTALLEGVISIRWTGIHARLDVKTSKRFLTHPAYALTVDVLELKHFDLFSGIGMVSAQGLNIRPLGMDAPMPADTDMTEGLAKGRLLAELTLDLSRPGSLPDQLREWIDRVGTIATEGKTDVPIEFGCISTFFIDKWPVSANITTRRARDGSYTLVVNKEFFKSIALQLGEKITDAETEILSTNPFKMQRLLTIMHKARAESEKFHGKEGIPEDAYRHVLWSYLLTKEYGPEFAELITDAHEKGDMTNTEAEHQMDYHNNAIGREYALKNYREEEILIRVLNDQRVIRKPE